MMEYRPSKEEVRARLGLGYVCALLDIALDHDDRGLCPFHEMDGLRHDPSFHLFSGDDSVQRWSCFPCGVRAGDVFDLIMRSRNVTFGEALEQATEMLRDLPPGYEPPRLSAQAPQGPDDWRQEVDAARAEAASKERQGLLSQIVGLSPPNDYPAASAWDTYLRSTWGWGLDLANGRVYMPHWSPDGTLVGCKIRHGDGRKTSLPGSRYPHLYGSWLGARSRDVLITEGESDAVWAGYQVAAERLPLDVLAMPRGAQSDLTAEFLQYLQAYSRGTIYLALDPDPWDPVSGQPGVDATRRWIGELQTHNFPEVRVCALPLGRDLRSAAPRLSRLLQEARRPLPTPERISREPGGYVRLTADGNPYPITNWTVYPVASLSGGDDRGYDVRLVSRGTHSEAILRLSDVSSVRSLNAWANRSGMNFTGNEGDRQHIVRLLEAEGAVVPEVFQTDRVGMHQPPARYADSGPTVVYPTGYHGKIPFRYAPTGRGPADVTERVLLPAPGDMTWRWLSAFLALSSAAVMHPFLAWLVASARREEARRFPLLFIGGSSGVGKSTLAELGQRLMGSQIEVGLGSVTPFVLLRTLSASATLPVFVDEWTRLSRRDTREALQGAIPALYTGEFAERGQADLTTMRYRMTAPTIIAGEDTFSLDREMERVIVVRPSRAAQNHSALEFIQTAPIERFGELMHHWLSTSPPSLPPLETTTSTRPEYNRNVLLAGWATLHAFLDYHSEHSEHVPSVPQEPDLTAVDAQRANEATENAYEVALTEGYPLRDQNGLPVVWTDPAGAGTFLRPRALIGTLSRSQVDVQLPGGERALVDYFAERYTVERKLRVQPPLATTQVWATLIRGLILTDEETHEP